MIVVTGLGMVSSLGLDVVASCAAARAGMRRVVETDDIVVPDSEGEEHAAVTVHRVPYITQGFFGFARLLQLGDASIADLQKECGPLTGGRTGFVLLTGNYGYREAWLKRARTDANFAAGADLDRYEADLRAVQQRLRQDLLAAIARQANITLDERTSTTLTSTTVGLVAAVEKARDWLSAGKCDRCILGAIDTLLDPTTLDAVSGLGLLKSDDVPAAMTPGEGGCFALLERATDARARRGPILASLEATSVDHGPAHPNLSSQTSPRDGLADAMAKTLSSLSDGGRGTGLLVATVNGDSHRASSLGEAIVRALAPRGLAHIPTWLPALPFGETGAASGSMGLAMLVRGWARKAIPRAGALLCLLDDAGGRATLYVRPSAGDLQ